MAIVGATARAEAHARDASWVVRLGLTGAVVALAFVGSWTIALANSAWFDFANGVVGAREAVARGLVFSSWLLIVGAPLVLWRPPAFGVQLGSIARRWRDVAAMTAGAAAVTWLLLRLTGATPYSDASLVIETIVVPVTEELVFRAVLLTLLLSALRRIQRPRVAVVLAVVVDGLAFGSAHLANAMAIEVAFVVQQATFASALGMCCALLMVRTNSVFPAILLHAAVNAVVVLA